MAASNTRGLLKGSWSWIHQLSQAGDLLLLIPYTTVDKSANLSYNGIEVGDLKPLALMPSRNPLGDGMGHMACTSSLSNRLRTSTSAEAETFLPQAAQGQMHQEVSA